jgi:hypothetical protein
MAAIARFIEPPIDLNSIGDQMARRRGGWSMFAVESGSIMKSIPASRVEEGCCAWTGWSVRTAGGCFTVAVAVSDWSQEANAHVRGARFCIVQPCALMQQLGLDGRAANAAIDESARTPMSTAEMLLRTEADFTIRSHLYRVSLRS